MLQKISLLRNHKQIFNAKPASYFKEPVIVKTVLLSIMYFLSRIWNSNKVVTLPKDILRCIFAFLDVRELCRAIQVLSLSTSYQY
jgi:type III secretory pathway component EscU